MHFTVRTFLSISCVLLVVNTAHAANALGDIGIHGFFSQGYIISHDQNFISSSEDGSFEFNELGVNFIKNITDDLRVGVQVFSRDFGAAGNHEVRIDWAYVDYRWKNWLGFKAGLVRPSIGLYNEIRDMDALRTSIFMPQSVYDKNYWDRYSELRGAGVYGDIDVGRMGSIYYRLMAGTYEVDVKNGDSILLLESMGVGDVQSGDIGLFYNGCLEWDTPVDGLRVRTTVQYGSSGEIIGEIDMGLPSMIRNTVDIEKFLTTVVSAEYVWNDLTVMAETALIDVRMLTTPTLNPPITPLPPSLPSLLQPVLFEQSSIGYYAGASYRFNEWFELGAYYSVYYTDKDDRKGNRFADIGKFNGWYNDFALSTRFDINDQWLIKLEGHAVDGTAVLLKSDNPDGFEKSWYMFAAKATFIF